MKVSNPLTIIAIFAGLAEALATIALVQLPPEIQSIFVYFVMAFPSGIVLLFFYVLYFKNTVLYAPSDYADQTHYLEANQIKETVSERIDEIFSEINKNGMRLTREEIEKAKSSLEESIEQSTSLPRKEQILTYLDGRTATTKEISDELDIHPSYVFNILHNLLKKGVVIRQKNERSRASLWRVNT